jgi:hypothetical protein
MRFLKNGDDSSSLTIDLNCNTDLGEHAAGAALGVVGFLSLLLSFPISYLVHIIILQYEASMPPCRSHPGSNGPPSLEHRVRRSLKIKSYLQYTPLFCAYTQVSDTKQKSLM